MANKDDFDCWVSRLTEPSLSVWSAFDHIVWLAIQRHEGQIVINYKCHYAYSEIPIRSIKLSVLTPRGGKVNIRFTGPGSYAATGTQEAPRNKDFIVYGLNKITINFETLKSQDVAVKIEGGGSGKGKWVRRATLQQHP